MDTGAVPVAGDSRSTFYADALRRLTQAGIPFLVGGAFAQSRYTHMYRDTKDLDLFLRPDAVEGALALLTRAGYETTLPYPHWLAKVRLGPHLMDVVFNSGNGIARVDDDWFTYAVEDDVLGMRLKLCPPEESIWAKAFVQERERFDGADVMHLIRARGRTLDWERLLARFGDHWRVLLGHLVLYGFVYPDRREDIPAHLLRMLTERLLAQQPDPDNRVCYGTLLSREQYLPALHVFGYEDARVEPHGDMTHAQREIWTQAIKDPNASRDASP